ncbi:MAG: PQQ-binding-like beta-propeller repeat protein [Gemmataceae bacterium]
MKTLRTLLGLALVLTLAAADWPQLLGPQRDGRSPETNLLDTWPAAGPTVVWQREVGEGYASPVVADGKLILFHRVGGEDRVEALDAATGEVRWLHRYATRYDDPLGKGNGPRSTPVVARERVFTLGAGGHIYCLDLKSGKKIWSRELLADYTVPPSYFGIGTTPLVEAGLVLLNIGGEGTGLIALDADTGKEKWRATDDEASYSSPIAATVDGARLALFFTRTGLVAVDPATGKVRYSRRWRARIGASVNAAMPVLLDRDHLFLSASYNTGSIVLKLRKDGFDEVWKNDTSLSSHFSTPVAVGEQLYGFVGRQEEGASLRAIDWKTGKVRWTEAGFGCGSAIAAGKKLFVLGETGDLALIEANPDRYEEKSRARLLAAPVRAHLALANGLLYGRDDRKLVCWKVKK